MSEYDGLNLPQLLEKMHELVVPPPVSLLPQTDGWWVLLGWLLTLLLLGGASIGRHQQRNRYRHEALQALRNIELGGNLRAPGEIAAIVKRTALTVYPRTEVASLYGEAWAEFLIDTGRNDPTIRAAAPELARAAYDQSVSAETVMAGAERWIRRHRD